MLLVLLGILVVVSIGALIIMANDRNSDLRFAYQRGIVGFHSAEAGIHVGAVGVQNAMQNFALPTNCSAAGTSFAINGRTVTYVLSVPTGAPWNGVAGSCAETPLTITEAQGTTFAGLNAQLYTYNLTSSAANALGFTEATVNAQFQSHLIPMFQFASFYNGDLELVPSPNMVINGRLHTNGDLYLNSDDCGGAPSRGLNVLGQITVVGSGLPGTAALNRGSKDQLAHNSGNVYISLDGTSASSSMQVLGTNAQGSTNCAQTSTRQIGASEMNSFNTLGPRIVTGIKNISVPSPKNMCVPWISTCPAAGGSYWVNANLRIALDTTTTGPLTGTCTGVGAVSPCLYPIEVLNADGTVNAGQTTLLKTFMRTNPGAITYNDVPASSSHWDCLNKSDCEAKAYNDGSKYATQFPQSGQNGCTVNRNPRDMITLAPANFCNDYRYGGFYSWREEKPILMLKIDWMALEEYNYLNGYPFFNPNTTTNGGLVVFLTVKDTTGTEGLKADNYGVRIFDAGRARRNLTDPGVTFATDQAMYVTGNFNCPVPTWAGPTTSPAPCGDGAWPPAGSSTYQKPVSVAADTINVLSCAWIQAAACGTYTMNATNWAAPNFGVGKLRPLDEQSTTCIGSSYGCAASATIVNAGFYSAIDQSWCPSNSNGTNCGYTYYGGGLENYPRLHEDWSGINFWYQGSFVASGPPQHTCFEYHAQVVAVADDSLWACTINSTQGFWSTQRYGAPQRRWFYDVSFSNASYLPPLTPRFVYLNLVYFTQVFQ